MTPATEVTELSKPTDYQNKTEAYLPRITTALEQTFEASDLTFTPQNGAIEVKKHVGKVRDRYEKGNNVILITTDRLTGFDRPLAKIPFKGQVLNQVSQWWFDQTKDIMPNHVISVPHPNVTIATAVKPFMVEFVVRGYLTGSTKTSILPFYQSGGREFCGNTLEEGLLPHQKLPQNIITPTSKSDKHDESLTPKQIVELGLMTQEEWNICSKYALDLFAFAQRKAAEQGLILVDTKMEMGRAPDGRILLIDELFTPDSSRYWVDKDYAAALEAGTLPPKSLDKEFIRLWFKDNCDPYNDETLPTAPAELVADLSRRYIMLFEMITGTDFSFSNDLTPAAINASVQRALAPRSFLPSFKLKPDYKKLPVDREMYADPLGRYISNEMSHIFSDQVKFATWHRLWAALADSQRELGLPVTQPQVDELLSNADIIDFEEAARLEKELRHDVMAHNRAYGQQCPMARNIIHWGATSSFVTCNTEMAQIKEALTMIQSKVVLLLQALRSFAIEYKSLPTLGYTHL